ncbi:hypothetical protein PR001_g24859 [Phytophthora rubi]|uniref:RxLR effector protein n=1 Tax=Phytophthora rubi TaxID=129364 RepID=A0A6A3I898_9STRA|nr:hypothetical protein PR002_g26449 [Phytophthora rubi]KAE8978390.1 hypothetical protein PR001_g24859 [Phytophthora rubi]
MRLLQGLLYAAAVALAASTHDVAASTTSEEMNLSQLAQKEGKEAGPAESRFLRKHVPADDEEEDDEERGAEWLTKLLKLDLKKLDDLPPQKAIEMVNLGKLDDVVNVKKLNVKKVDDELARMHDDFKFIIDDILPQYKKAGGTPDELRKSIIASGVTQEGAINSVLNWLKHVPSA